ncbi:unnamed protein product [Paramecium pentaurelia]|uniref:P-loop containing nucleoside triphosphate hydrolase n=1 Tax=Paramecium pentaurelia TaxID=43138 RepID=A0A8S1SST7_9CILI|nr:unnamed protein product [Paramecium pentaurelia]
MDLNYDDILYLVIQFKFMWKRGYNQINKLKKLGLKQECREQKLKQQFGQPTQLQANKIYYNITHRIKEVVTKQPVLLEGGQLQQYQVQGLDWLVSLYNNSLNGILADEMGLGKTIQAISLLCYLIETKKNYGPFFIIAPLSTLSNWVNEFEKWAPKIKKVIYKGTPQVRQQISKQMSTTIWNICLTTYEFLLQDNLELSKYQWKYIIVDEGHSLKNSMKKLDITLGQQYQHERRLLLTSAPLQNNIAELRAMLKFLLPKVFSSDEDFEKWFQMPQSQMGFNEKDCQLDEEKQLLIVSRLQQVLRPFLLRRLKKDVEKELQQQTEYVIKVKLSAWQKKIYDQINQRGITIIDQQAGQSGQQVIQNIMMQLRKICNHPYLLMQNLDLNKITDEIWRSSGKFELLDRIIPKLLYFKHKLLIFTQMTQLMDIMETYFKYRGWQYLRVDESLKSEERESRINLFNQENSIYNIFILNTMSLGLNLQQTDIVLLFDSDWDSMMDLQVYERANKIGQKSEVKILRLITAISIEVNILTKEVHKMGLDAVTIQANQYYQKSINLERLQDFFKQQNKVDLFETGNIPDDNQINEWIAINEEELEMFKKLDRQRYEEEKQIYKILNKKNRDNEYFNYRLIQDDEFPEWIKSKQIEEQEVKQDERDEIERKQNDVLYFDYMKEGREIDANDLDLKNNNKIDIEQKQNGAFIENKKIPKEENLDQKDIFDDKQEILDEIEQIIQSK